MFALAAKQAADALRSGADLVVEFATLGEYRLPAVGRPMERATPSPAGWAGCPDELISWSAPGGRGAHRGAGPVATCPQRPG